MYRINFFLITVFFGLKTFAQGTSTISFTEQKRIIDSIVALSNNNKELLCGIAEGNSKGEEGFDFNIYYYYNASKEIIKLEYNLYGDSERHATFYYNNHHLLLIAENNSLYYFVDNKFRNFDGGLPETEKINDLTKFEADIKNILMDVLKEDGYKM